VTHRGPCQPRPCWDSVAPSNARAPLRGEVSAETRAASRTASLGEPCSFCRTYRNRCALRVSAPRGDAPGAPAGTSISAAAHPRPHTSLGGVPQPCSPLPCPRNAPGGHRLLPGSGGGGCPPQHLGTAGSASRRPRKPHRAAGRGAAPPAPPQHPNPPLSSN